MTDARTERSIIYLPGDPEALAAIRDATRSYYSATDIPEDAMVIVQNGIFVQTDGQRQYEVPDDARALFVEHRPFPASPVARMPDSTKAYAGDYDIKDVGGVPLEGEAEAIDFIRMATRLYHEMSEVIFPEDAEVRWFKNGLFVVGADKRLFQVPMDRVDDLIVPQVYPNLPTVRMTQRARDSLR